MDQFRGIQIALLSALVAVVSCGDDGATLSTSDAAISTSEDGSTAGAFEDGSQNDTGFGTGGASGGRGKSDVGGELDAGEDGEAITAEDEPDSGETDSNGVPIDDLADYLPCETDSDCPVGFGDCVTTLPLSVSDQGTEHVSIEKSFPALDSEGICTRVCTNSSSSCDDLSLEDQRGDSIPYTCQLIYVGASPYPDPMPSFPFNDQVDGDEMTAGVPFAAICRPPFGLAEGVLDEICDDCTNTDECGDGICWDLDADEEADEGEGSCLASCDNNDDCPGGFECDTLSGVDSDEFCVPVARTCGACRDRDDDGFGVGQCADDDEATPVDCDEDNPLAYYDPDDMSHPFPENCGEFDYNCNGLSDADEQSGADVFGAEHCGGCDQPCSGELFTDEVQTADALCVDTDEAAECVPDCVDGYADCNGELDDGCEVEITDPNSIYYRDADGDGDGDPEDDAFACNDQIPEGYVAGDTDCDDSDPEINGTLSEVCDGKDNDCDGSTDEGWSVGDPCDGEDTDQCPNGTFTCTADGLNVECVNESIEDISEACDGEDTDCDGFTDEGFPVGDSCDGNDADQCPNGTLTCMQDGSGVECVNETITDIIEVCNNDSVDEDCDGTTDEGFDGDGDGYYSCIHNGLQADCDDNDASRYPTNGEICDGKDNDCDGSTDETFDVGAACDGSDADYCANGTRKCTSLYSADCVETISYTEECDGADNDCDGDTDEGYDNDDDSFLDEDRCPSWATDCCDFSADVRPNQTAYFEGQSPCGGWDYNCDGVETKDPDINRKFVHRCSWGDCIITRSGYVSIPSCGQSGQWISDCTNCDVNGNPTGYINPQNRKMRCN